MTPATHFAAALDAPFIFARQRFREYAPTIAICVLLGVLPGIPQAFIAQQFQTRMQGGNPFESLALMPLMYVAPCLTFLAMVIGLAVESACIANILDGRGGGFGAAVSRVRSGRFWSGYAVSAFLNGIGVAFCCFGGFLLVIPFGLMIGALLDENRGVDAIARSTELSLQKTGPGLFDRPGWKAAAVFVVAYVILMVLAQAAALPMYVSMGSTMFEAIKSGHPEAMQQAGMIDPWLQVVATLVNAVGRVFIDTYAIAGTLLVFRDAKDRLGGADLARLIDETPRG